MKKPRLLVCLLVCAVVVGVVTWSILSHGIPKYKGRPLTDWVNDGYTSGSRTHDQLEQANEAVRAVGTNALSYWVTMLGDTNDSKFSQIWNVAFSSLPRFQRPDSAVRRYWAFCALYVLGADAKPAVPELTRLLECHAIEPNQYATIILAGLGPEGVGALTNALANTNLYMRFWIAGTLGGWNGKPPNHLDFPNGSWEWPEPVMNAILPALIRCVRNPDDNVRIFSAQSLGFLRKDPAACVPVLTEFLSRETNAIGRITALESLGRFGSAAKPARPAILPFLADPDFQTHRSATNALQKIDPKATAQP